VTEKSDEAVIVVRVGFNQQQRQLIERLKASEAGKTDAEIVRFGFARWLESEGWLSDADGPGGAER
jgi:hypothetical protein